MEQRQFKNFNVHCRLCYGENLLDTLDEFKNIYKGEKTFQMTGFGVYLNRSDLGSTWHNGASIESSVVQIIS
jgi:hypothetical protein